MAEKEFDPVAAGQAEAAKNAKADKKASESKPEKVSAEVADAQKLAKANAKLDDSRRGEARMEPQDVGTAERDIPEGKPVTDQPEEEDKTDETPEVSTDLSLKELQAIAEQEGVEGDFTKPGTSKQSVVDAILAKRDEDAQ